MKMDLDAKLDSLGETPWTLDVGNPKSPALSAFGITMDFHHGEQEWGSYQKQKFLEAEYPKIMESLRSEGIPVSSRFDAENRGDANTWYIEPNPTGLSSGITLHSPVLSGEEGINQANKVMAVLHRSGCMPTNEPTICAGAAKVPQPEEALAAQLETLNWRAYPKGNPKTREAVWGGREEVPVSLQYTVERKRLVTDADGSKRQSNTVGTGYRPIAQAFINYMEEHPELGVEAAENKLLFRGTKHIDPELCNRSKAGIVFASDRAEYAGGYADREDLIQTPFSQSALPAGVGFLHVYEKAAGQKRFWKSDRLEDNIVGLMNATGRERAQQIISSLRKHPNNDAPSMQHSENNDYRMGDTLILDKDRHVSTFLVDIVNARMIDVRDIPEPIRKTMREQQFGLEAQYMASRPPEQISRMVAQSQASASPMQEEYTSHVLVPKLQRAVSGQEAQQEFFKSAAHRLFPQARDISRGNAKLQEEVLGIPQEQARENAVVYGAKAEPTPLNRHQKQQLATDFSKVNRLLQDRKPENVSEFLQGFRDMQKNSGKFDPQSKRVDEQIIGQRNVDPHVQVQFFHNTQQKPSGGRGGRS